MVLELRLSLRFTFYIYYVSTKLTAHSLCITMTLQMVDDKIFKYKGPLTDP